MKGSRCSNHARYQKNTERKIGLSRTHRTDENRERKRTKVNRNTAPRYQKSRQPGQREAADYGLDDAVLQLPYIFDREQNLLCLASFPQRDLRWQPRRSSRPPSHRPAARSVVAQQLHGDVEGAEDPGPDSVLRGGAAILPPKSRLPGQQAAQVHQAHLQRSTSSGTRAAAMMPDREWTHGLHVPLCLICLARFTRRASSSPALLALLPLREQVLRERPARCWPPSSCDKDWGEKHKTHTK